MDKIDKMKREREEIISELQVKRAKYEKIEDEEDEIKSDIKRLKYELNSLVGINRFPSELMALILNRLKASDLFACERVCRRWSGFVREFVRGFGSDELIISEHEERRPRKWKFPKKFCSPKCMIVRPDLQFEDLESSFLIELRRLKIINNKVRRNRSSLLNDLDFVNKLQNLEVLEVSSIQFESEAILTLPHLRCLAVSQLKSKLKLATPELSSYEGKSLKQVEFVFKEKVTHLHLNKYHADCKQLNNLQYLALKNDAFSKERTVSERGIPFRCVSYERHPNVDQLPSVSEEFLNDHPNLKKLSIRPAFNQLDQMAYLSAKSSALRILEQKKSLKRDDFQLIFFGVQLENAEQLATFEFNYNNRNLVRLHLLNYQALCVKELRWVKRMHLSGQLNFASDGLDDDIPQDFYEKFDQVEEIVIPVDLTELQIAILKKFKNLNSLIVRGVSGYSIVNNDIIEKLPDELPNIRSFEFEGADYWELDSLEGFVFKFKKLSRLLTDASYHCDTVNSLLNQYDVFEVTFQVDGNSLMVIQRGKGFKVELWKENCYSSEDCYPWKLEGKFDCVSKVLEEIERFM